MKFIARFSYLSAILIVVHQAFIADTPSPIIFCVAALMMAGSSMIGSIKNRQRVIESDGVVDAIEEVYEKHDIEDDTVPTDWDAFERDLAMIVAGEAVVEQAKALAPCPFHDRDKYQAKHAYEYNEDGMMVLKCSECGQPL